MIKVSPCPLFHQKVARLAIAHFAAMAMVVFQFQPPLAGGPCGPSFILPFQHSSHHTWMSVKSLNSSDNLGSRCRCLHSESIGTEYAGCKTVRYARVLPDHSGGSPMQLVDVTLAFASQRSYKWEGKAPQFWTSVSAFIESFECV